MSLVVSSQLEAINEKVVGFYRKKISLGDLEACLEDALCTAPADPNDPGQTILMRVDHLVHLYREGREVRSQEVLREMLLEAVRGAKYSEFRRSGLT